MFAGGKFNAIQKLIEKSYIYSNRYYTSDNSNKLKDGQYDITYINFPENNNLKRSF